MLSREICLGALAPSQRWSLKTIPGFGIGSKSAHSVPAFPRVVAEDGSTTITQTKEINYLAEYKHNVITAKVLGPFDIVL